MAFIPQIPQAPAPPPLPDIFGPQPMEVAVAVMVVVGTIGLVGVVWMLARGLLRKWSGAVPADPSEVQALRQTVQQLGTDVAELQERLDFTERMLARAKVPERIERGER
jgi:hypothetical protein